MTFRNIQKSVRYVATAALATMILVAFSAVPALATTTINVPAYTSWNYWNVYSGSTYNTNDQGNASPSFGNVFIYSQPQASSGLQGQNFINLIYSSVSLGSGQTITLSNVAATVTGTLYVDPVGGTNADINILAFVSVNSDCSTDDSTNRGVTVLQQAISSSSWSVSGQTYSPTGTTSYTAPSGGQTVYICGYVQSDSNGGFSYSDFGSSGSSNKISDFKITATY